jgi:hypothetical protein
LPIACCRDVGRHPFVMDHGLADVGHLTGPEFTAALLNCVLLAPCPVGLYRGAHGPVCRGPERCSPSHDCMLQVLLRSLAGSLGVTTVSVFGRTDRVGIPSDAVGPCCIVFSDIVSIRVAIGAAQHSLRGRIFVLNADVVQEVRVHGRWVAGALCYVHGAACSISMGLRRRLSSLGLAVPEWASASVAVDYLHSVGADAVEVGRTDVSGTAASALQEKSPQTAARGARAEETLWSQHLRSMVTATLSDIDAVMEVGAHLLLPFPLLEVEKRVRAAGHAPNQQRGELASIIALLRREAASRGISLRTPPAHSIKWIFDLGTEAVTLSKKLADAGLQDLAVKMLRWAQHAVRDREDGTVPWSARAAQVLDDLADAERCVTPPVPASFSGGSAAPALGAHGVEFSSLARIPGFSLLVKMLPRLNAALLESSVGFRALASSLRHPEVATSRQRSVYPCPPLTPAQVSRPCALPDEHLFVVLDFINLNVVMLNWLAGVRSPVSFAPRHLLPNALHDSMHQHVGSQVVSLLQWLALSPPASADTAQRWIEAHEHDDDMFPKMDADRVDGLKAAGLVDPLPCFSKELQEVVSSSDTLFAGAPSDLASFPDLPRADIKEYARYVVREVRSGKLRLRRKIRGGGSVFCRRKKGHYQVSIDLER